MGTEATKPNGSSKSKEIPVLKVDEEEIERKAAAYNVETHLFFVSDEGKAERKANKRNSELVVTTPNRINHKEKIKEVYSNGIVISWGGRKNKKRKEPTTAEKGKGIEKEM